VFELRVLYNVSYAPALFDLVTFLIGSHIYAWACRTVILLLMLAIADIIGPCAQLIG
jgi:hypothetical protein